MLVIKYLDLIVDLLLLKQMLLHMLCGIFWEHSLKNILLPWQILQKIHLLVLFLLKNQGKITIIIIIYRVYYSIIY